MSWSLIDKESKCKPPAPSCFSHITHVYYSSLLNIFPLKRIIKTIYLMCFQFEVSRDKFILCHC